jgi:hypothetical protein
MMQDSEFPVRRMTNGTINYDSYRTEASHLRAKAKKVFWRRAKRFLARQLTVLIVRTNKISTELAVFGKQHEAFKSGNHQSGSFSAPRPH